MKRFAFPLVFVICQVLTACGVAPASQPRGEATSQSAEIATLVSNHLTNAVPSATPAQAASGVSVTQAAPVAPAGLKVVYSQAGNLALWNGSSTKQLTASGTDTQPRISQDGQVVVFLRGDKLWAVDASGSGERRLAAMPLVDGEQVIPFHMGFAPHSHDLYFSTTSKGEGGWGGSYDDLIRINADKPVLQQLLIQSQGGDEFTFSPDGKQIALAREDKIDVFQVDGNLLKTVFTFPVVFIGSDRKGYIPQAVWMSDSSGFMTVIPAPDAIANPAATSRFMFVPADGSQAAQLAAFSATADIGDGPRISPDGTQVLYLKIIGDKLELHIVDASTADRAHGQFPATDIGTLQWAPDSVHFSYSLAGTVGFNAWVGSQAGPAASLGWADQMTWVDANHFLFMENDNLGLETLSQTGLLIASGVDRSWDFSLTPNP